MLQGAVMFKNGKGLFPKTVAPRLKAHCCLIAARMLLNVMKSPNLREQAQTR